MKYSNKPDNMQKALKELKRILVIDKIFYEIKSEVLRDYVGEFEMVGRLKIADQTHETHIRIRNKDEFESYFNAIDQDYESEDAIFDGYIHKINTPQFNCVN